MTQEYIARFVPQAWVNDYAIEIDLNGEPEWNCTNAVLQMPDDYRLRLLEEMNGGVEEALDANDFLKHDEDTPQWVRNHQGPFSIYVRVSDSPTKLDPQVQPFPHCGVCNGKLYPNPSYATHVGKRPVAYWLHSNDQDDADGHEGMTR